MGKLIDFFSRRQPPVEDFTELVENHGRYVGCLPKQRVPQIRGIIEELDRRKAQIYAMIDQWNDLYDGYADLLSEAFTTMKVDEETLRKSDRENEEIFVDENGHCWLVYKPKDK